MLTYTVTTSTRGLYQAIQGDGARFVKNVSDEIRNLAMATAPSRSGALRGSHNVSRLVGSNQSVARYEISAGGPMARHAENVHEGYPRGALTSIPNSIWADSEEGMSVPAFQGATHRRVRRQSVAGQAKQPWLEHAGTAIALRYGAIAR
jgi:hypothetical protein